MKIFLIVSILVLVSHFLVFSHFLDWGTNLVLLCANLFFLFQGFITSKRLKTSAPDSSHPATREWSIYVAGYLVLFVILVVYGGRPLLFPLLLILYAALFRLPRLLGYLGILILSIVVITPYWLQSFMTLSLLYSIFLAVQGKRHLRFHLAAFAAGFILLFFILFPLLYLLFRSSPQTLLVTFKQDTFRSSLYTSLITATSATIIVLILGVPLAYAMVRMDFRGKRIIDALIALPVLIPQTVVGIALLVLLGPKTPIGAFIYRHFGLSIAGSYFAIVTAQVFVSSPFLVFSAVNAFQKIDPKIENISRTLGASPLRTFFAVSLPLAAPEIFNGCILTWSRALSEMGSLMVLAYHPFTISIFTHDTFTQYGLAEAEPIAILFVIICLWIFILLRWIYEQPARLVFLRNRT